jgi:hypothetical protein
MEPEMALYGNIRESSGWVALWLGKVEHRNEDVHLDIFVTSGVEIFVFGICERSEVAVKAAANAEVRVLGFRKHAERS